MAMRDSENRGNASENDRFLPGSFGNMMLETSGMDFRESRRGRDLEMRVNFTCQGTVISVIGIIPQADRTGYYSRW